MRGARGSHQGKRLVSLSRIGFPATTDLSVRFHDVCQGAEPMVENGFAAALSLPLLSPSWYLPGNFRPPVPAPLAAAERPSAASQ